jgi:sugar lactone lactonase YvrE
MQVVADFGDLCGECPVWDSASNALYWTDSVAKRFYKYAEDAQTSQVLKTGFEINGFRLNRTGGFVVTNNSGIWLWDGNGEPSLILSEIDRAKCRMNDCTADPAGRLFAGSCFYDPSGSYERGKLMRVDVDGRGNVLDEGFELANGPGFSPRYDTLYFTDSVARRIYEYDYDQSNGDVRNRRVFVQVPPTEGLPDGLAVDEEGFVWSAQWYGSCLVRYDPDGKLERRIETPAKQTSSLAFGGEALNTLFITSAGLSEPMPVMPPGYDHERGYFGGALYCEHVSSRGMMQHQAAISVGSKAA